MSEPFIGEIIMFGGTFAPRGWAFCDGQLLSIASNSALFSILGTTYGGDGRTSFGLPDLRGRVPMHAGNGPGLATRVQGQKGGSQTVTLSTAQLPSHTHQVRCQSNNGNSANPVNAVWADDLGVSSATYSTTAANANMAGSALQSTGGGQAHTNEQPYLAVRFIIALVGIYPSRN